VPYANLSNPQTLNLYAMVTDDPESFADLDGHTSLSWADQYVAQDLGWESPNMPGLELSPATAQNPQPQQPQSQKAQTHCGFWCQVFHTKAYDQMTEEHR